MNSRADKYRRGNRQQGAALVEMAIVILVFLILVFGIIEFALMIFQWSRLVEATRAGARYAIVNDAACSIYAATNDPAYKCSGGPLDCTPAGIGAGDNIKVVEENGDCTVSDPYTLGSAACQIVSESSPDANNKLVVRGNMRGIQPLINDPNVTVRITYTCTDAGFAGLARKVPTVTVEAIDVPYYFSVPGLFGGNVSVNMPPFATTRTGEDLHTVN